MISKDGFNPERQRFARLLHSARDGSSEDRAELIEGYRNYLRTLAAETLGNQRAGQLSASDIVQTAIIDANRGFEHCRAETDVEFRAWLKRILLNDVVNHYRHLRTQKRDIRREQTLDKTVHELGQTETPSSEAIRKEDQNRLEQALTQLTKDQRQVVTMRQRDQMSFPEIASALGRTPESTRKLWSRAVAALAVILREAPK